MTTRQWWGTIEAVAVIAVLGLNMARVAPFATGTLLFVLPIGWLSLRLRRLTWRDVGLVWPANGRRLVVLGLVGGVAMQALLSLAVDPLLKMAGVRPPDVEGLTKLASGGIGGLVLTLLVGWIIGGLLEEMCFRGYLLSRVRSAIGGRRGAIIAVGLSGIYFGLSHWYQGPNGVIEAGLTGLLCGAAYVATGGNLLLPIILHGAVDTVGIILLAVGYTG